MCFPLSLVSRENSRFFTDLQYIIYFVIFFNGLGFLVLGWACLDQVFGLWARWAFSGIRFSGFGRVGLFQVSSLMGMGVGLLKSKRLKSTTF